MKDILSIYEFKFPFVSKKTEYLKYSTIIEDIKRLFIYEELFLKIDNKKLKGTEVTKIYLKNGIINIIYNNGNSGYHVPIFFFRI